MEKVKYKYRRWWFDGWQAGQAEAWLEDLALAGWRLESIGMRYAKFTISEPAMLRYACVPRDSLYDGQEEGSIRDAFFTAGWQCIDDHEKTLVFCAPEGTVRPDIPWASPGELRKCKKHLLRNEAVIFASLIVLLPLLCLFLNIWNLTSEILLHNNFRILVAALFYLICLGVFASDLLWIRKLNRLEAEPDGSLETEPYQKTIFWRRCSSWLEIAMTVIFLFADKIFRY